MSERAAGDPVNELSKKKNRRCGRRWQRLIAGPQFHSLQMCFSYICVSVKFFLSSEKKRMVTSGLVWKRGAFKFGTDIKTVGTISAKIQ